MRFNAHVCNVILLLIVIIFFTECSSFHLSHSNASTESNFTAKTFDYDSEEEDASEEARKKKKKLIIPIIYGIMLAKSLLLPLAVKGVAAMSMVSLFVSTFSLIVSSLIGYLRLVNNHNKTVNPVKVVHLNDRYHAWSKEDNAGIAPYYPAQNSERKPNKVEVQHIYDS